MKRTIALLLTVLMVLCCIPSTLMTAFAVDPSFTPNSVRNQTYDGAYNQYIPETVIVDGNFDDTAWAYEDWKDVSTVTGSWNTDPSTLLGESVSVDGENVTIKASNYSYRFQLKTDYEYFYGAIELNYDWNGDVVIWLNDGRWENCTDRIVINPTITSAEDEKASVIPAGALRIERAIHTVIDPVNNTLDSKTHKYDVKKYEKNAAGAFYPAMCYPSGNYVAGESDPKKTDWVDVTDELKAYQYASEETLYRCVKDGNKTRIEFRILNYAFECGKIEQDGEQQQEDYNPNYHYYVSVGFGYDNGGAEYNEADYHPTTVSATKTYYSDINGTAYDASGDHYTSNGIKLTKEEYYYDAAKGVRPALYYPRIEMKDGTNRAQAIPSMKNWPASTGLIPDILFANDTANNEEKMVVDGNFTEEIWSTLTDKHMGGSGATLDLSNVLYSTNSFNSTEPISNVNEAFKVDRYQAGGKKTSFKMEMRYDGTYIYGAAIAFVPDGGAIMPRLTLEFAGFNSELRAKLIVNGGYTSFTDKNGVYYTTSSTDIFQCYRQKIDGLWNFEFKFKADLVSKDASNKVHFNAHIRTDLPYVSETDDYLIVANLDDLYDSVGITPPASGYLADMANREKLAGYANSINFINSYIAAASFELSESNKTTSEKVIFDGKVDTYDWAALNAFDNVVSGQYQDDYVVSDFEPTNPLNVENAVNTTNDRNIASYYKLTSDGEYLYGGAIVQFGSDTGDYWHSALRPGGYTAVDGSQFNYNKILLGEIQTKLNSDTSADAAYQDIDLFKIWLTCNPEHTNSLEREGATAVLNIAIIKREVSGKTTYEAYSFVDDCTRRDKIAWPSYDSFKYDTLAIIDQDSVVEVGGQIVSFSMEFKASLRSLELNETKDQGFYGSDGTNNRGDYELVNWYAQGDTKFDYKTKNTDGWVLDKNGNLAYVNDREIYSTEQNITGEFEDSKYYKTIDGIKILESYEYNTFNGYTNSTIYKAINDKLTSGANIKDYYFIERARKAISTDKLYNHVDYTKNDQYFGYYVTIENAIDSNKWQTAETNTSATTTTTATVTYGRLISKKSESPIAPDAWTGHVYAAILNGEAHWWRRNFFNVEATHKFGYSDMLDNMVVDGKLDEHLWHVKGEGAEATSAMSSVTPVTGVWKKNPTQNEVFSYTYYVWTDNNYVYGAAWLDKEIVKCGSQIGKDECTKLEIHFENAGKNYTFDMYFKDDNEVTGNYYIDGTATKPDGGLDSYFQKTITYANQECYFEFRIDLSLLGYSYASAPVSTSYYLNNVGYENGADGAAFTDSNYNSGYTGLTSTDGTSNIKYHLGISQPCSTGAAYEVLTLFADPHGALKTALAGKGCEPDYAYDACVYPGLTRWNASDAMEIEQTEHFAGEKIRVDGTLNDTGWNENRWIDVDRNVNASENKIYDDLQYINMKYMIRSDDEYYYIGALMDVTFNSSTRPAFTFWILNETGNDGEYDVDYIKLSYDDKQNSYPYSQSIIERWDDSGKAYTNSKLYECYDVEDLANGKVKPTFYGEEFDASAELAKLSILNGNYTYRYSNNGDKNVVGYDPNSKKITFQNISIETSLHNDNGDTAGLYGESEVMQEMNEKFDIVNYGQIVGKQHAVIQSANGVMINNTPGKSTQTVVEFRVKKSSVDKDGNDRPGFKYAVQATATFNNQEYDLIYPYVDNKVGEERERDDYNYPNTSDESVSIETDAWVETAVDVNEDSHLRYRLRNNTNGVVTLGSKTASEGEGENTVYKMRFGALYTEDYIRNQKFAHTAIIDSTIKNDEKFGNVKADYDYVNNADGYHGGAEAEDGADTKYTYWDITKLGIVIYPTYMLYDTEQAANATNSAELNAIRRTQSVPLSYYAGKSVVFAQAHSIVTWHGNANVHSNYADYESFQYYIALTGIKAQNYGMKYSFAAMNSFDYIDITSESEIGNGENLVETREDTSEENEYGYIVKPVPQSSKYLDLSLEENQDVLYNGRGVDVNYYYGAVLERSPQMVRMVTNNGTIQDGDDSSNEESALPDNENEGDYNGEKVAYIPLDNRPVNKERVEYLAQSAGFELLMPEEDFYRTATKGQKNNSNGKPYGNQEELLSWLYQIETSEDVEYYIISLDQLFYGGLAESTSASRFAGKGVSTNSITEEDQKVIDYLIELAKEHYVYYFTSITPTVGLEEYVTTNADWSNFESQNSFVYWATRFTEVLPRVNLDFSKYTKVADFGQQNVFSDICGKYYDNPSNETSYTPPTDYVSTVALNQLVTTRLHKLQIIQELASAPYGYIDHLVVGVDDDRHQTIMEGTNNIQTNEINYVKALFDVANKQTAIDPDGNEIEVNYNLYTMAQGIDQLGLGGISNLSADLYATQVEHFSKKNGNLKYDNNGVETDLTVVGNLGVDVKVEYIGTTSETTFYTKCTEVVDEVRYGSKTFDDLINEQIIAAGGRRIVEDKSKALGKGTLVLLVVLPGSESNVTTGQVYVNLATRALAHMQSFTPVAIVAFGHYGAMTQLINGSTKDVNSSTINNPGRLLATYAYSRGEGHDFRNTPAQAVGITISNAIARYSYLTGPRQTVEAHEGFYKYMGYSWINDFSYNSKGLTDLEMKDDISSGTTVAKSEANDYNSAFYKYGVTTFDSDEYFTRYQPQWIAEELNLSQITTRINVERDGDVSEFSNLADIMIGNGVNPLNRPHEFTFDVAVIENGGDNVARNKDNSGKYIVNRSKKYGTFYTEVESEATAKKRLPEAVFTVSGNNVFESITNAYPSTTHKTAVTSNTGAYSDILADVRDSRNYTISVTNDSYIDNEEESVTNYRFSYDAELTDGHAYKYLETVTYDDGTIPADQIENGAIRTNSVYKGFSNNQWWCLEQNYNCHYAGNGVYFGYVVVDLKDNYDLGAVRIHLLNDVQAEVHEPGEIRFLYSTDGTHFTYLDSFATKADEDYGYWSMLDAQGVRARYVKIEITLGGQYAFMNEIEVYAQDTQTLRVGTYNIGLGTEAQNMAVALGLAEKPDQNAERQDVKEDYETAYYTAAANNEKAQKLIKEAIKLIAEDIEKADLDIVFLQEIPLNTGGYTFNQGLQEKNMVQMIAYEAGLSDVIYLNRAVWRSDVAIGTITHIDDIGKTYNDRRRYHKVNGNAVLTRRGITLSTNSVQSSYESLEDGSAILTSYQTTDPEKTNPAKNYDLIYLNIPTGNNKNMEIPVFSAHCTPETLNAKVLKYTRHESVQWDESGSNYSPLDKLIVGGDFNNPTFKPLKDGFGEEMSLTVNDINKLVTNHQGKSMDNIVYDNSVYTLMDSGVIQSGNSDHYLVWAELQYTIDN